MSITQQVESSDTPHANDELLTMKEVANVVRVDEDAGLVYYMAHSGDNPMKLQLHCVRLDGTGDKRLTDPAFHHTIDIAPDGTLAATGGVAHASSAAVLTKAAIFLPSRCSSRPTSVPVTSVSGTTTAANSP